MEMRLPALTLTIKEILLELSKFNEITPQQRWDIEHAKRPIPQEWIENYDNELQKVLDEYIYYGTQNNNHFVEVFNWQQDIIQNSLVWNYLRKKATK